MATVALQLATPPTPAVSRRKVGARAHEHRASIIGDHADKDVSDNIQGLIMQCNQDGMGYLGAGDYKGAFEQLKYAEAILLANNQNVGDPKALLASTCNNLGCYYKKIGKYHGALNYLRRALKMEVEVNTDEVTLAGTHLNLCAVMSKLDKHGKAVQHAIAALDFMSRRVAMSDIAATQDDYTVLAVCYHNIGMERAYLRQWDQAATAYQTGHQVAKRFVPENRSLAAALTQNCEHALLQAKGKNSTAGMAVPRATTRFEDGLTLPPINANTPRQGAMAPMGANARSSRTSSPQPPAGASLQKGNARRKSLAETLDPLVGTGIAPFAATGAVSGPRGSTLQFLTNPEEDMWSSFAEKTLKEPLSFGARETRGSAMSDIEPTVFQPQPRFPGQASSPSPSLPSRSESTASNGPFSRSLVRQGLSARIRELDDLTSATAVPVMPGTVSNLGHARFFERNGVRGQKQTPLGQALDDHPEKIFDIIDMEGEKDAGGSGSKLNDFRPNRSMKRSTRTSKVVRRTGMFNSTFHRDRVEQEFARRKTNRNFPGKNLWHQNKAAARIQHVWRDYNSYCKENSEYITMAWVCATMIQSSWRSYHIRRMNQDRLAKTIQRHVRGYLVRKVFTNHKAAVSIQKHIVGVLVRTRLARKHAAAMRIQRMVRGFLARKRFSTNICFMRKTCIIIQRYMRVCIVQRVFKRMLAEKHAKDLKLQATIDCQRYFRGWKDRQTVTNMRQDLAAKAVRDAAATKIQALHRRVFVLTFVAKLRRERLEEMNWAATLVRKMWLGVQSRKKYKQLRAEFNGREPQIVSIQRYARGYVTRMRLFRDAMQLEELLWAAVEIQRCWKGYRGRVFFEDTYEVIWCREFAAAMMQRNVRGWLARVKQTRKRRAIARAEFERARARFRGAQKIQALARGVSKRGVTRARLERTRRAAVQIQKISRGHALRTALWQQILTQRATMIAAMIRGWLVRRRLLHVAEKVLVIQRFYRRWRTIPVVFRWKRLEMCKNRKARAAVIQRAWRHKWNAKCVAQIKASGTFLLTPQSGLATVAAAA